MIVRGIDIETWVGHLALLANHSGLDTGQTDLFLNFFTARFPNCRSLEYAQEWAGRLQHTDPTSYMDEQSKEIYRFMLTCMNQHPTGYKGATKCKVKQ